MAFMPPRTKWTSPLQLPKFLTHEGLAPLCEPMCDCEAVFLCTSCSSLAERFLLYRKV